MGNKKEELVSELSEYENFELWNNDYIDKPDVATVENPIINSPKEVSIAKSSAMEAVEPVNNFSQ